MHTTYYTPANLGLAAQDATTIDNVTGSIGSFLEGAAGANIAINFSANPPIGWVRASLYTPADVLIDQVNISGWELATRLGTLHYLSMQLGKGTMGGVDATVPALIPSICGISKVRFEVDITDVLSAPAASGTFDVHLWVVK